MLFRIGFIAKLVLLISFHSSWAQQSVRGIVKDHITGKVISNAGIGLIDAESTKIATTDSTGIFKIKDIKPGRYSLKISHIGYKSYFVPEIQLNSGKDVYLEVMIEELPYNLDEVVIKSGLPSSSNLEHVSSYSFTVEETMRYAATHYDPARFVSSIPGVIATNDQANHLSIRGNSPNSVLWRLEGVDILNPNHLANGGTFSDRPSFAGGGVNILSMQMLGNSTFLSGGFSPEYGNVLGGVFDMRLRDGNNQKNEYTAQIGIMGIDVAAEGPISKKNGSSFLANYRYSTLGILGAAGVPLGDEQMNFQDFSYNLTVPLKRGGKLKVFGMWGTSSNIYEGVLEPEERTIDKESQNIRFRSSMAAAGVRHEKNINESLKINSVIAVSGSGNHYRKFDILDNSQERLRYDDQVNLSRVSFRSDLSYKINTRNTLKGGAFITANHSNINVFALPNQPPGWLGGVNTISKANETAVTYQPFVSLNSYLSRSLILNSGVHFMYFDLTKSASVEPRLNLTYLMPQNQSFNFSYGQYSQTQTPLTYYRFNSPAEGIYNLPHLGLGLSKSQQVVIAYNKALAQHTNARIEIYHQDLYNIPVGAGNLSALNFFEDVPGILSNNNGRGRNQGIELSVNRKMQGNWYYLASGTLYDSKFRSLDGEWYNTRFNGNYAMNFNIGKEYIFFKKERQKVFGVNLRGIYAGGMRQSPIDLESSRSAGRTVYNDSEPFSTQLPDFYRFDFRISYRRNKEKYSTMVSLDVINTTARQNVAGYYYDSKIDKIVPQEQLGLIPILNYRVEF
jgi:hypothetical protein